MVAISARTIKNTIALGQVTLTIGKTLIGLLVI